MRCSLALRSVRPSTPVSCQRVSHLGEVSGRFFCQKPGRAGAVREALEVERPVGEVRQHRRGDAGEVADQLALGDGSRGRGGGGGRGGRAGAGPRLEQRLVQVRELQLVTTDLPGAFLAEGIERGEFGVGGARERGRGGRGGGGGLGHRGSFLRFGGTDRCGRGDRGLASDALGVTPRLDPLVGRLAHVALAGPAADLGPDHELRPYPRDPDEVTAPSTPVVLRWGRVERRVLLGQRHQGSEEVLADAGREAAADLARESQLAVFVDTDGECPKIARIATPRGPATDHELLLRADLELEPRIRSTTGLVPRPAQLGDDPFDPHRRRRLVEREPLPFDMGREAHPRMLLQHAPQEPLPILQRDVEQAPTVEIQQVEGLVDEARGGLVAELGLEEAEVRPSIVVEGDDLAIDDGLLGLDPATGRGQQPREIGLGVVEVAGPDPDLAAIDDGLDPIAIPLDLEQPVGVAERLRCQRREHRVQARRERCRLRPGEIDLGGRRGRLADPDGVAVLL